MKKGPWMEARTVEYLNRAFQTDTIERRVMGGANDRGDVAGVYFRGRPFVIEVKNRTAVTPAQWFREQTEAERGNADADFALLVVRVPQRPIAMADCYVTYRTLDLMLGTYSPTTDYERFEDPWVCMHLWQMCLLMWGEYENGD